MALVNVGLGESSYPVGPFNEPTGMAMLSDGTLIMVIQKDGSSTVLGFWYSTDLGATWTKCTTELSGLSGVQGFEHGVAADEFDNIFVKWVDPTNSARYSVYTFDGTDVTYRASLNTASAVREKGTFFVVDNPTITGNKTHLLYGNNSGGTAYFYGVNYDRDTPGFDTPSSVVTLSIDPNALAFASLQASVEDYRVARTPSAPKGIVAFSYNFALTQYRLLWNATNHDFDVDTNNTAGHSLVNDYSSGCYNPTSDQWTLLKALSTTTSAVMHWIDATTAATKYSGLPTFTTAERDMTLAVSNGLVTKFFQMQYENADGDLTSFDWDGSAVGTENVEVSGTVGADSYVGLQAFSLWTPAARAMGVAWGDWGTLGDVWIWIEAEALVGGIGWGWIPIGG